MTREEYDDIQARLTKKMNQDMRTRYWGGSRERDGYQRGILTAKSILHKFYNRRAGNE